MNKFSTFQRALAALWFVFSGLLAAVLLAECMSGNIFGDKTSEAWGWFLPTVMPTLGLMASVLVADIQRQSSVAIEPDGFLFGLAFAISFAYLAVVAVALMWPDPSISRLQLMTQLSPILGPCQGLASTLLGVFFFKAKASGSTASPRKPREPRQPKALPRA
jgi:hypothetical protein